MRNVAYDVNTWVIDTGASFHVSFDKGIFSSYQNGDFGNIWMGNGGTSKIVGVGDIVLTCDTGCKLCLRDVRHVPDMHLNLISAGKLDEAGSWKSKMKEYRLVKAKDIVSTKGCMKIWSHAMTKVMIDKNDETVTP